MPPHEDAQGFLPADELSAIVQAGVGAGCDRAILIGGEPTIYPHLDAVFSTLADLPARHIVMTNGLRMHDPRLVERLQAGGVATVHISVDTADSATYDRLSRSSGRLPQQLAGLDAALRQFQTYVYVATSAINAPTLPKLLQDVHDRSDRLGVTPPPVVLAVVKPIGDGLRHAEELLLAPAQSAGLVRALVGLGARLGVAVGYRNVQACLLPELVAHNVDYYLDDFSVEVATGRRLPFSHGEYWRKPPSCADCGHDDLCTGVYRDLQARYGDGPYLPIGRDGLQTPPPNGAESPNSD